MPISIEEIDKSSTICFPGLASREGLTPTKLIRELKEIAFSDLKHHITVDDGGAVQGKPLSEIGKRSKAVKKIKERTVITESKDGEKIYKESTVEYELHDKLEAINMGLNIHGMKAPKKVEVTGLEDTLRAIYAKRQSKK